MSLVFFTRNQWLDIRDTYEREGAIARPKACIVSIMVIMRIMIILTIMMLMTTMTRMRITIIVIINR